MPAVIDWDAVRAEYIAGGISQRELAKKYSVTRKAISVRSVEEGWVSRREEESAKKTAEILQKTRKKTAEAAADNAVIAARIRTKLLLRLERALDEVADGDGTTARTSVQTESIDGKQNVLKTTERRLKDIADIWKVVSGDTDDGGGDNELLRLILESVR